MILARAQITLVMQKDIYAEYRYYLLQASTLSPPSVPTVHPPAAPWNDTEPGYTAGSTNSLYTVDCTVYSDGTFQYTPVSLSSSYEAAKQAYNQAVAAAAAADNAQDAIDNLSIGGRNLIWRTLNPQISSDQTTRPRLNGMVSLLIYGGSMTAATHGARATATAATRTYFRLGSTTASDGSLYGLEPGETYTISFDASWKILSANTNTTTYYMRVYLYDDSVTTGTFANHQYGSFGTIKAADRGVEMSGRCEFTFTIPESATMMYLSVTCNRTTAADYAVGDYFEIRNLKLEKGNRATDWSPAPEDHVIQTEEAVSIANGKTTAYYQTTAPTGGSYRTNDIWFDTNDGNKMYYWNGSAWTAQTFGEASLSANAVTADKIAASAVTAGKIAAGAVSTDKLAANAVTAAKIAAGTITATQIASGTITASNIKSGTITATQIASGTITGTLIASETITGDNLVAATITGTKIAATTITADNIASNAITAAKISSGAVTAAKIGSGAVTTVKLAAEAVTAAKIAAATITADKLAADVLTAGNIKLYGKMAVYTNSTLGTTGGYIGYMAGNNGTETTNGIAVMCPNGNNYLIATDSGVRLTHYSVTQDNYNDLVLSGNHLAFSGNYAMFGGNTYLNATLSSGTTTYSGTTTCNALVTKSTATIAGTLTANGSIMANSNVWMPNAKAVYGKDSSGNWCNLAQINSSNEAVYGNNTIPARVYCNGNAYIQRPDGTGYFNRICNWTVLWTNSALSTAFAAQTKTITNLGKYNLFYVACVYSTSYTYMENGTLIYVPGTGDSQYCRLQVIWYTSSKICATYRYARFNRGNNTVTFSTGTFVGPSSLSDSTSNAIPSYILAALI